MREQRTQQHEHVEIPLRGRRRRKDASNSLEFLANIEGDRIDEAHIRSANGMRWRLA